MTVTAARSGPEVAEPDRRWQAATRFFIAVMFCALALVAVTIVFVETRNGQRVDDAALRGRVVEHPRTAERSDRLLRTISVGSLTFFGLGLIGIAAVRGRWHLAAGVGAVIAGSNITTQVYKHFVERPHLLTTVDRLIPFNTLPSGHTTVAASLAAALVLVAPVRLRPLAATVGALYACGIAAMTLAAGWHRPSDAVSAFAVVGIWTFGVSGGLVLLRGTGRPRVSEGLPALLIGMIAVLVIAFGAITVSTTIDTANGLHAVRFGIAYVFALAAIVAVGVVFIVTEVLLLRGISLDAPRRDRSAWT